MTWFRVDDGLHSHKKSVRAGIPAMGLWVIAGSWCADQLTDGFVPDYIADRLDPDAEKHAAELVEAGLWFETEHDGDRGWQYHQWTDQQPTREEVQERQRVRAEAGRRGGQQSASNRASKPPASAQANGRASATASAQANAEQDGSDMVEAKSNPDPTRPDPTQPTPTELVSAVSDRADVDRLCTLLADRIEDNGSKRPRITERWRNAARLMLDTDGRTEEQIAQAIDWCQRDEFWRANILSMPKLREKYDQLRLIAAGRPGTGLALATSTHGTHSTTDQRVANGIALAQRLAQEGR